LTNRFPKEGIVVAHRYSLPDNLKPKKQVIVCIKPDTRKHPFAQLHITDNHSDNLNRSKIWPSKFIPHWTQIDLKPRDDKRCQFCNVAFVGDPKNNLKEEFRHNQWAITLKKNNFNWKIINRDKWNDFSNIDAIVAVRPDFFDRRGSNKSLQKLYNAWTAGVPIIIGNGPEYQTEKKSDLDFIKANNSKEVLAALKRLRKDIKFRQQIIENGKQRAQEFSPEQTVEKWINFLHNVAVPYYQKWQKKSSAYKKGYFLIRLLLFKFEGLKMRVFPDKYKYKP
jgi:hypothetical protein